MNLAIIAKDNHYLHAQGLIVTWTNSDLLVTENEATIKRNFWNDFDISYGTNIFRVIVCDIRAVLFRIYVDVYYGFHSMGDYVTLFPPITGWNVENRWYIGLKTFDLLPLLLTWFTFNPSMDK